MRGGGKKSSYVGEASYCFDAIKEYFAKWLRENSESATSHERRRQRGKETKLRSVRTKREIRIRI